MRYSRHCPHCGKEIVVEVTAGIELLDPRNIQMPYLENTGGWVPWYFFPFPPTYKTSKTEGKPDEE